MKRINLIIDGGERRVQIVDLTRGVSRNYNPSLKHLLLVLDVIHSQAEYVVAQPLVDTPGGVIVSYNYPDPLTTVKIGRKVYHWEIERGQRVAFVEQCVWHRATVMNACAVGGIPRTWVLVDGEGDERRVETHVSLYALKE